MDPLRALSGLYACGHSLFSQERYGEAAAVFRALAAMAPDNERGWLGLGACHEKIDQHGLAVELYGAGEQFARSARCAIARARTLRTLDRKCDAESALDAASDLAAGDSEIESIVRIERSVS